MKKFLPTLLFACALALPPALTAASFEGKVTMQMTGPTKEPIPMVFSIKEGFSRTDMTMGQGMTMALIMDQTKKESILLMPSMKMYKITPFAKTQEAVKGQVDKSEASLEKTGETEKILGYTCEKYLVKFDGGSSQLWVTDQLGTFMGMGGGGNPMSGRATATPAWEKALAGKNFFPLRNVTFDKAGKEIVRMEASAVEKQSIPASAFTVPADFQKMPDMGDMMKGMVPGAGGR